MDFTDKPQETREGEILDASRIEAFLKDEIKGLDGELKLLQFPGGHSNLTYFLEIGGRELVLRRPPFGTKAKSAHDMGREYRVLNALHTVFPYAPRPLAYTEDESIIGCPFYVMERLRGVVLRRQLPEGLTYSPEQAEALCRNLVEVHAQLHDVDYKSIGLETLGKPEGYVRRQIEGWSRRYRNARTPDAPDCEEVMAWLPEKMPPESDRPGIIHNDFKFDNVVLDPENPVRLIGVLDWEMSTLGDPIMDLGSSLAYWIDPDDHEEMMVMHSAPPELTGVLTRQQVVDLYSQLTGRSMDHYDFYYAYGLFRLGVIAQQIYYRFYHGQTNDERFQRMIYGVHVLDNQARRVIGRSDL